MPKTKAQEGAKGSKLGPIANALIKTASEWRIEADQADADKTERRSYADGLRECADAIEEFARS
jgi:hypothetical protein